MASKNEPPDAAEFGRLRAYLAHAGVSQAQIKEAIGQQVDGRTRAQVSQQLRGWIKNNGNPGR